MMRFLSRITSFCSIASLMAGGLVLALSTVGVAGAQEHDMSGMSGDHDMSSMSGDHDMSGMAGMKMDGMSHMMSPADFDTLRERVPGYKDASDEQIMLEMQMMGANAWRYLSPENKQGSTGVLVLIHGFGPTGDRIMDEAVKPLGTIFPTAIAAGMAMMGSDHIQAAIDRLTQAGAKKIIVVPLAATKYNSLIYQWDYVFGRRDQAAYLDVPRVKTDARLMFVEPIGDHPLVQEILLDNALEMSTDPANEVVFIVAHGPHWDDENQKQLAILANISKRVKEIGGFSDVRAITLQDDAPAEVRAANVKKLREWIEEASAAGKTAIVVADLLSARSIQWKIERDLKGLDYKFSVKGISQHPNFAVWLRESVMDALKASQQEAAAN